MSESILSDKRVCFVCGVTQNLERHHIYYGTSNRKLSEADGCFVYLCREHHTGKDGAHFNRSLDLYLKTRCQTAWERKNGTREDFIKRYGKSYI